MKTYRKDKQFKLHELNWRNVNYLFNSWEPLCQFIPTEGKTEGRKNLKKKSMFALPIRHNYDSLTPAISTSTNLECYKHDDDDAACLTAF
jgi:hypothetical protein